MRSSHHEKFMRRAIALARRGIGRTSPNPAVGCVIVRDGVVVGEGWHRRAGTPHAEVHALRQADLLARNADLYVTLEPCSHFGKTPPCADAIIAAGIRRVFAGMVDPNPKVSGRGLEKLRTAGVEVVTGLMERDCVRLNEPFIKHVTTGMPFVILKCAMTMDGKTASVSGDSKWITCDKSRKYVHRLRSMVDAVMAGVGTVLADDPQLTARIPGGRDPLRVIVDSHLRSPLDANVFTLESSARTMVATVSSDAARIAGLEGAGADILQCDERDGRVDLQDLLLRLGGWGIQSVLLEGGHTLAGDAVRSGLVDKLLLFYAPKLLAGEGMGLFFGPGAKRMTDALSLRDIDVRRFGDDILVTAYPEMPCLRD